MRENKNKDNEKYYTINKKTREILGPFSFAQVHKKRPWRLSQARK